MPAPSSGRSDKKSFLRRKPKKRVEDASGFYGTVRSVCCCEAFNTTRIADYFLKQKAEKRGMLEVTMLIDVVWVQIRSLTAAFSSEGGRNFRIPMPQAESVESEIARPRPDQPEYNVFFFSSGIVVWWSSQVPKFDWLLGGKALLQEVGANAADFEIESKTENIELETMRWNIDEGLESGLCNIDVDVITLPSDDPQIMLAISHGLAQSVKLSDFEQRVEEVVSNTRGYPQVLDPDSHIPLPSSEALAKMRGQLFLHTMDINLHTDMLDTPEYFWTHSDLEPYYLRTRRYMEISNRVDVLNKRLEIVQELFQILSDEINTHVGNRLEWYIIWLLAVDFVVGFAKFLIDFFQHRSAAPAAKTR
eukprot:TRINITY_DN20077_c0_g1_i1.p1 TRINITY_DN20077_c0_g1~~TRINITY_DN20077_c0_g1_i1.p1  ORF type:complete len:362 (+),score=81.35 TRINITY_DN20077_c0_g1_i1:130-1215(+)